jgi:S-adenosylmethionine:diacylglycerol 3-amino-3-carboxypropyl transferase
MDTPWIGTIRVKVKAEYVFDVDEGWEAQSVDEAVSAARDDVYHYMTDGTAPEIWDAIYPEVISAGVWTPWLKIPE